MDRQTGKRVLVVLFILWCPTAFAQQQLATDTYAIFEQSCLICHGPDGAYRETLLIEHNALISTGSVVAGNPDASELYKRLITTETAKRMPLGQPQLPSQSIETIRHWILAGAPDWSVTTPPAVDFTAPGEILDTIESHLTSLPAFDRAFARYFTLTHLRNAGVPAQLLGEYRKALNKLINSLSWGANVINPHPIDPHGTIFYMDLRHYEWDRNDGWGLIEAQYPYHIPFNAPTQASLKTQLGRLQNEMKCDIPAIHVDWFIAQASLPPLYHDLLDLPLTDSALETRLEVDVIQNLLNAPGVRVWRAGTNNSGVSNNNRAIERHTSRYGAYWKSYDFDGSVGRQNIFTHPLSFTADGGEVIFNLPNGLQGYYITNATGFRLDDAPINIVSNPAASDPTVRNGLSCFGCHTEGMKTFADEVRSVIESNTTPAYDKAQALRLYVPQAELDALVAADMDRYRVALQKTGGQVDEIEPISRFHEVFEGTMDAAYAAAAVGLETDAFLEKIRENMGLQNAGLLVLDSPDGRMKRDAWTDSFDAIIFALDFPESFTPPTDETPSTPGTIVRIPDRNLHIAIAEALNKSPNAPITVEEMLRIRELHVDGRDIRDLTGLQFATSMYRLHIGEWWNQGNQVSDLSPIAGLINLERLYLARNPISDLSPLRGLTNLRGLVLNHTSVTDLSALSGLTHLEILHIDDTSISDISPVRGLINFKHIEMNRTSVSDISPVRGLINLTILEFKDTSVSDLSPVSGLTNLTRLEFHGTLVTDLSPLAGLINLERLSYSHRNLSDLSPLAGLINLKGVFSWGNSISDLSPLAGLTKLEMINFCGGDISDLSPLAGLTGLKELYLADQEISDISPLVGLTGLTRLDLHHNDISDISVLARLKNLTWLYLRDNDISDISPLASLTNLKWLNVAQNQIVNLSPLDGIRKNIKLIWYTNPVFPADAPKIEGPWLWVVLPGTVDDHLNDTDLLSEASNGAVTETEIATHGATVGKSVGDAVWTAHRLPPAGVNNIEDMLKTVIRDGTLYGAVPLYSPREQETTMYVGGDRGVRVWLNGALIYERLNYLGGTDNYTDFFPVTLRQGRNVLLVAVHTIGNGFFGFEPGTEYTVPKGIGYTFTPTPIHIGDTFTFDIRAENITNLAGWQFDVAFDPAILEALTVTEGDFLKQESVSTFFQGGSINNGTGRITGLNGLRLSSSGATGSGSLLKVDFRAKGTGETQLRLQNLLFANTGGESIAVSPHETIIIIEGQLLTGDVNRDGSVNIIDLILISQQLNQRVPAGSAVDLNGDGVVSILDLLVVVQAITPAAPQTATNIDRATIESWIAEARLADDGSVAFKQGIKNLLALLRALIPETDALLRNYPNPFNPETWIPYQLAHAADVQLSIYDVKGELVRRLELGYQLPGYYTDRTKAAYWDGRNGNGESVASGVYFYALQVSPARSIGAGEYTATRRMVILK